MLNHIRHFIDTRISVAVSDIRHAMSHLEINNNDRHKAILNRLDKLDDSIGRNGDNNHNAVLSVKDGLTNNRDLIIQAINANAPVAAKPQEAVAKKPFVGRELKNETLIRSKEWEALSEPKRALFVTMVKGRFNDIEMQAYYEAECFRQYLPVTVMLSDILRRAADYTEAECL